MKREELKELGLNEEQIDKVVDINGKDITKLQHDQDNFKSQVNELSQNLTERDGQISELSKLNKGIVHRHNARTLLKY